MRRILLFSILAVAVAVAAYLGLFDKPPTDCSGAVRAENAFAIDLYAQLAKRPGNLVFSPVPLAAGLAMVGEGARGNTALEIAIALHGQEDITNVFRKYAGWLRNLGKPDAQGNRINLANSLWVRQGYSIFGQFRKLPDMFGGGSLHFMDFTGAAGSLDATKAELTRKQINSWAAKQTHGKITAILPAGLPDQDTRMILANIIYFDEAWEEPFHLVPAGRSKQLQFHVNAQEVVDVPMMSKQEQCKYYKTPEFAAVEIPYRLGRLSMVVLLPTANEDLTNAEKHLDMQLVDLLHETGQPRDMEILLPKFKVSMGLNLREPLRSMGIRSAFSVADADFSGITTENPLCVEAVLQSAWLDVNETGTDAAAASTISLEELGAPTVFAANRPFLFLIRENSTGAIIFLGRITNPVLPHD